MAANFGFPYDEPYAVQSQLMEQVYSSIQNKSIAFLESPTGTVTVALDTLSFLSSLSGRARP
jgi:Rad3-related DNA helicase